MSENRSTFSDTHGPEILAVAAGAVGGIVVSLVFNEDVLHATQGTAALNEVHGIQSRIATIKTAQKTVGEEAGTVKTQEENVLAGKVAKDNTSIHNITAHNPLYAGGQVAEAASMTIGSFTILGAAGLVAVYKFRRGERNQNRRFQKNKPPLA